MTVLEFVLLLGAALAGGILNAVAGGGSLLTFPALLLLGVPPLPANASSAVALWPGSFASAAAYREDFAHHRRALAPWSLVSAAGGLLGALLLLHTPSGVLEALIPWLMLGATLLFALGGRAWGRTGDASSSGGTNGVRAAPAPLLAQLLIATYGGYFGGGMGILMLAAFSAAGMRDIHTMNGMKSWLAVCINGIAVVTFVAAGAVLWPQTLVMTAGAVVGGYLGAARARRIEQALVRRVVIAVGTALSGYFFLRG